MRKRFTFKKAVMIILLAAVAISFFGYIVMLLWNNILPAVLNISPITFWQALGILLLSKILFGGFRGGGRGWHRRHQWKQRMQDKLANMTPEEREKFKQQWQMRCGRWRNRYSQENNAAAQTTSPTE